MSNFLVAVGFTLAPADDGQPFHVTKGDAGGPTSFGITQATLSGYLKRPATLADVQAVTQSKAVLIYEALFWQPIRGDSLPDGVDVMVFDHAVLNGPEESVQILQAIVGVETDGIIGPLTLAAVNKLPRNALIGSLAWWQAEAYRKLVGFAEFGNGWLARVNRRKQCAYWMLNNAQADLPSR